MCINLVFNYDPNTKFNRYDNVNSKLNSSTNFNNNDMLFEFQSNVKYLAKIYKRPSLQNLLLKWCNFILLWYTRVIFCIKMFLSVKTLEARNTQYLE